MLNVRENGGSAYIDKLVVFVRHVVAHFKFVVLFVLKPKILDFLLRDNLVLIIPTWMRFFRAGSKGTDVHLSGYVCSDRIDYDSYEGISAGLH